MDSSQTLTPARDHGRKRIAVVGSGAGGCGAIYALQHTDHEVHVFEAAAKFGGHSCSQTYEKDGLHTQVDVAFVGFNRVTYPNFCAMLDDLGVETNHPPNTLSISRDNGGFEWATSNIFAQPRNMLRPSFWRMLFDIVRFNQYSPDILRHETAAADHDDGPIVEQLESIGGYIARNGYSEQFLTDYLLPMTEFIWSTDADKVRNDFPICTLVRYLWNHHLLVSATSGYNWMSVRGSSTAYVDALLDRMPPDRLHRDTRIAHVRTSPDGSVLLETEAGESHRFDHVILATHGPQAMKIIDCEASAEERAVLSAFKTTPKQVIFHSDPTLMPKRRDVWSCWNYVTDDAAATANISLTCWGNLVMDLPARKFGDLFVSVQPHRQPAARLTHGTYTFEHPWYTAAAVRAQRRLPRIQNRRGLSYCGAWTNFGLHEDGFASGIQVAVEHCGGRLPFRFVAQREAARDVPPPGWRDRCLRVVVCCVQALIRASNVLFL